MDSLVFPFFLELEALMRGVPAFNAELKRKFALHVYLLFAFGDMPAVSKLMRMKGINRFSPYRACLIHGVADPEKPQTLYTPLFRSDKDSYDPPEPPSTPPSAIH
jgi:hypothetical protein